MSFKVLKDNKHLPIGLKDYSNENVDSFLKPLYENNIKVLDFHDLLIKEYASLFDAFYKTDHHWKPETGFWATKKILNFLNDNLNKIFDESIINYKNFNFKIYPKLMFGSQGKKVSLSLAEPEDFTLITPKFNTQFSFEAYCREIKREGPYEKSILELTKLHKNYYEISTLGTYLVSDCPVVRIKNNLTNNNKKILMIKDSFAVQVIPFLSCATKEILLVERRTFTFHFNGSMKKIIEKEKPDIVLCLYYTGEFYPENKNIFMISNFE